MSEDVTRVRAEIDAEIDGKTVLELMERNATQFGSRPALAWRDGEVWKTATWAEYRQQAIDAGMGMRALGAGHGDFIAIMTRNIPQHVIADVGAGYAAATGVSVYNTLAADQIQYIASNCGAKIAVVENRDFMKRWEEVRSQLPDLTHIVMIEDADDFRHVDGVLSWDELLENGRAAMAADPGMLKASMAELTPEDPATLVYTSGTTGPPKGVVITHRNVRWMMTSIMRHLRLPMHMTAVSYLPLAHVAERAVSHAGIIERAGTAYFCPELTEALDVAKVARPYLFLGVPRVWEKARTGIIAGVAAESSPVRRALAQQAIDVSLRAVRATREGSPLATPLGLTKTAFDRVVFSKIRAKMGLDQTKIALTGSAPCAEHVHEFFSAIGLPLHDTWGMTELTLVATIHQPGKPKIGTVGVAIPGVEIKIAEDGEILARGGNVTRGYFKRPAETAETYDADGWVHSGDLGSLDADGHLIITGRKKEIIITAGGKNISPANIEALIKRHPLIAQACVVGDARPYLTALIVLDGEALPGWAKAEGVKLGEVSSLAQDERVRAEVQAAVDDANRSLSKVESIKRFTILPSEWTAESGELTPSLKVKRNVIRERYAADIEELYI